MPSHREKRIILADFLLNEVIEWLLVTSLPSGSEKGKVAVSQGIVDDESEVHIQLKGLELHKLREEIHECKRQS
jgi:hypothetical protein